MVEVRSILYIPKDIKPGKDIYPKNKIIQKGYYIVNQWEYSEKTGLSDVINLTHKDTLEHISFLLYNPEKYTKDWSVSVEYL